MKTIVSLILTVLGFGCATMHEKCMSDGDRYGGYNQCMATKQEEENQQRQALGNVLQGMGNGASRQTHCTTYYYGSVAQTTCN